MKISANSPDRAWIHVEFSAIQMHDGCPVQCAAKTMQHAEIEPAIQIVVTEWGIEKSHDMVVDEKICTRVVEKVKEELAG